MYPYSLLLCPGWQSHFNMYDDIANSLKNRWNSAKKFLSTSFFIFLKINHATFPKLYRSYYPHRSRNYLSPVCRIFLKSAPVLEVVLRMHFFLFFSFFSSEICIWNYKSSKNYIIWYYWKKKIFFVYILFGCCWFLFIHWREKDTLWPSWTIHAKL